MKVKVFLFLLLSVVLFSCSSIKKNYLGKKNKRQINLITDPEQLKQLDSIRILTDKKADSLINVISNNKPRRKISAQNINLLYKTFASQLNYDRIYNTLLQNNRKLNAKSDTILYYKSLCRLLESAHFYNTHYQKYGRIRRPLNRGEKSNKIPRNVLQKSRVFLYSPKIRKLLKQHPKGGKYQFIDSALSKLPSANFIKSGWVNTYHKNDRIVNSIYYTFHFTGKNLMGTGSPSKIISLKQRKNALQLAQHLQPYDIILSKSTNILAAAVIPGHFGHAAIWMGKDVPKKRKKNLHPHEQDTSKTPNIHKKGIIEAIRSGVRTSTLKQFADGDDFIILRVKDLKENEKDSVIKNVSGHLKKDYDFNFDMESSDKINCTELVYLGFDFIHWKTSNHLGRTTIFPDDMLLTALENQRFEVIALIQGNEVKLNPDPALLLQLID